MTNRDAVSKVRTLLRFNNSDVFISDRAILSNLSAVTVKLAVQNLNRRIGWGLDSLFTTIPCLEMEKVPLYSCCDTQSDCMIAASVKELPTIVDSYYSLAIKGVMSIDNKVRFKELDDPTRYVNFQKIYPGKVENFFWVKNKKLYITNPNIEAVSISAFFSDVLEGGYDCGECGNDCPENPLDQEWKHLPKLADDIIRMTVSLIMETFSRVPQDNTSNGKEDTK